MAIVRLNQVSKQFGAVAAVDEVTLTVGDGEFVTFVGPSGCGKTTTLRMIAGLEAVSGGEIWIGDRLANDIHPADRDVAMVFQSYALYPHMSVYDNIAYSLRRRRFAKAEVARRVEETAALLRLSDLLARRPSQLSGGQRQRVALGRAIVRRPAVFLMDEPLSNLDAQLRVGMRTELLRLHAKLGITTIYVTHDQIEAMTMADRVVVMNQGRVEQLGRPLELYKQPATLFVAGFVGTPPINVLRGSLGSSSDITHFTSGPLTLDLPLRQQYLNGPVIAAVRPQQLFCTPAQIRHAAPLARLGSATVDVVEHYGPESFATLSVGEETLTAAVDPAAAPRTGTCATLWADPAALLFFDEATGLRRSGITGHEAMHNTADDVDSHTQVKHHTLP